MVNKQWGSDTTQNWVSFPLIFPSGKRIVGVPTDYSTVENGTTYAVVVHNDNNNQFYLWCPVKMTMEWIAVGY